MNEGTILNNISNRAVLIICMIFAALFWFLNRMGEDYKMEIRVPIIYERPDSMTFSSTPTESIIYIVNSKGWNFLGSGKSLIERDSLRIYLDNSQQQIISQSQLIRHLSEPVLRKFEIVDTRPQVLEINQEKAKYKRVPVHIPTDLKYRKNYDQAGKSKISPDSIWVKGPVSDVNNIDYWRTDSLILKDVHKDIDKSLKLLEPLSRNISLDVEKINLHIPVEQFTENTIYAPIDIINAKDKHIEIFPTRTRLKFKVPVSRYDAVTKEDFKVVVDGSSPVISDNKMLIHISLKSPWVKDLDFEPRTVEFFTKTE